MNTRQGLVKPLWFHPARHLWKLWSDRDYRISAWLHTRYGHWQRRTTFTCHTDGLTLTAPDAASFLSSWDEIFSRQLYRCELPTQPKILDLGANIGLATLYFLRHFPAASITAVEPDPEIFSILQHNLKHNGGSHVQLIQAAAWVTDGQMNFQADGADGGRVSEAGGQLVKTVDTLRLLREGNYDFVKMDIEGAERTILPTIVDALGSVNKIFVEYHGQQSTPQALDAVVNSLSQAGFRLYIESLNHRRQPLMPQETGDFELQLNIFGWRT